MSDKKSLWDSYTPKEKRVAQATDHLRKEDIVKLKKYLDDRLFDFVNKKRNDALFQNLKEKGWLETISSFPNQEIKNSTIVIFDANKRHNFYKLGLRTDYLLLIGGGGLMTYTQCPFHTQNSKNKTNLLNNRVFNYIKQNRETRIERIFLISSFPFPYLGNNIAKDPFWSIKQCVILFATTQKFQQMIFGQSVKVESFLLYNNKLCLIMSEKVLAEKNIGKIGYTSPA